jgi:(2S)-methylsuccinyl-CoA dehydrogenase
VPEAYGGAEFGNLAMILTTEELSRASLAAAGSLITRPEILTKALLSGGTEEQKKTWLPRIASGELMV